MKTCLIVFVLIFSVSAFSQTDFNAVLIKDLNVLSISVADDGIVPPFEGGMLWSSMAGIDQRKYIDENGFSLECDGLKTNSNDIYGSCTFNIPMKNFQKIGNIQVYKLKGSAAAKLSKYFVDNADVSLQNGNIYLYSHKATREFLFGINDSLIQR